MRRHCQLTVIAISLLGLSMLAVQAQPAGETARPAADQPGAAPSERLHPSPQYAPDEVIRVQLRALADNDNPYQDAGIEIAFRFASPANTMITGPLNRFIRMVHTPQYRPMLHHRAAQYGALQVRGDQARQAVILTASNGERVGYIFVLSRQPGAPCQACWMTDSVLRFAVQEA